MKLLHDEDQVFSIDNLTDVLTTTGTPEFCSTLYVSFNIRRDEGGVYRERA